MIEAELERFFSEPAVEYVEHADLSHTYAREESARTLDWLGVPQGRSVGIT